jgi:hypothetical protein
MKLFTLILSTLLNVALTTAQSSTPISSAPTIAAASASTAPYTITALPAVSTQPSCIFNCLIPIGLADPSGCDDVNNECACLSAPADVLNVLTGCIETVCQSSTSAYAAVATSLYQSYCQSVFGAAQISAAYTAESAAAAASASSTAGMTTSPTVSTTAMPSATGKSGGSVVWAATSL